MLDTVLQVSLQTLGDITHSGSVAVFCLSNPTSSKQVVRQKVIKT